MGKPKPSDIYKRAQGYGRLAEIARHEARELHWVAVPGYSEYEVNENRQVRRRGTKHHVTPYNYPMRPNEGEFVDFWIHGQKYIISLDTIMAATFPKGED